MTYLIFSLIMFVLGVLSLPALIYIRARKADKWKNPSILKLYKFTWHVITNVDDFYDVKYKDGKQPFWYLTEDEFADVVKSRP